MLVNLNYLSDSLHYTGFWESPPDLRWRHHRNQPDSEQKEPSLSFDKLDETLNQFYVMQVLHYPIEVAATTDSHTLPRQSQLRKLNIDRLLQIGSCLRHIALFKRHLLIVHPRLTCLLVSPHSPWRSSTDFRKASASILNSMKPSRNQAVAASMRDMHARWSRRSFPEEE